MMKKRLMPAFFAGSISLLSAQVGIGTPTPDANIILQIESKPQANSVYQGGILFTRVALTDTAVFAPVATNPVNGLIVYNNNTNGADLTRVFPGYYFWSTNSNSWQRVSQSIGGRTAVFSNENTTTDLNSGANTLADLFAIVRFNNNTTIYNKISNTVLEINSVGYYKIIINLDLASTGGADNFGVEFLINGAANIVTDKIYIPGRWDDEGGDERNFPNGRSYIAYIPVNRAGDRLSVRTYELDPNTDVTFKNRDTSTISIEKIR